MFDLADAYDGDLVRLEVGEPDFDTPGYVIDAAARAARAGATHYTPNAGTIECREAIAEALESRYDLVYDREELVVTVGGMERLLLAILATVGPGEELLAPGPTWPNYATQATLADGAFVEVPMPAETGFDLDPDRVIEAMREDTGAVVLTTPNNPTGRVFDPEDCRAVVEAAADHDAYVIADEVYLALTYDHDPQAIASFSPSRRTYSIANSVDPRQVLYLPLEESLYHATPPTQALDALINVIEYHQTRIAPRNETRFVILDDIGALKLSENRKQDLVDALDNHTYLYTTGIVHTQVQLPDHGVEESIGPMPMLPMKFIDALKQSGYGDAGPGQITGDLADTLEHHQSNEQEGLLHRAKKQALRDNRDIEAAVEALEEFYNNVLSQEDRDVLADAARDYLRTGGLLFQAEPDDVRNDLVKSHFLLYLYKELARYQSIKQPENLHRLCAIIANTHDQELNYNTLSDALGVDRRTIDTYFEALDDGLAVTESHDYSLQRHRRTRPYLRNPRHIVSLSQRETHYGYETYSQSGAPNPDFEYRLAQTVGFDHAMRLAHGTWANQTVEYTDTGSGVVDYILRLPQDEETLVLPFALEYAPHGRSAEDALNAFDPTTGTHLDENNEPIETSYRAPYRFLITDRTPGDNISEAYETHTLVRLPYWLYLLLV